MVRDVSRCSEAITRKLAAYDSTATTMFYTGLAGLALMAPLLPWIWTSPASLTHWALLFGVALFGTLGHWLLVMAHARAPANVLAPFIYTQLLWSVTLGFLLFGDVPSRWTVAGAMIVVGSGLYLLAQETIRQNLLSAMPTWARRNGSFGASSSSKYESSTSDRLMPFCGAR